MCGQRVSVRRRAQAATLLSMDRSAARVAALVVSGVVAGCAAEAEPEAPPVVTVIATGTTPADSDGVNREPNEPTTR